MPEAQQTVRCETADSQAQEGLLRKTEKKKPPTREEREAARERREAKARLGEL